MGTAAATRMATSSCDRCPAMVPSGGRESSSISSKGAGLAPLEEGGWGGPGARGLRTVLCAKDPFQDFSKAAVEVEAVREQEAEGRGWQWVAQAIRARRLCARC